MLIQGYLKAYDQEGTDVYIDQRNAIHYENFSVSLAESMSNLGSGFVSTMNFGNGGTSINNNGIISYLTPNSSGANASLYNETYSKIVDSRSANNIDPTRNKIETRHVNGTSYTDMIISCLLDYGEPQGQDAFDTASDTESLFLFDEIGLRSFSSTGEGRLLTHVIFHPVQKSLNRLIQIDYTVRVQSLSGFNGV